MSLHRRHRGRWRHRVALAGVGAWTLGAATESEWLAYGAIVFLVGYLVYFARGATPGDD